MTSPPLLLPDHADERSRPQRGERPELQQRGHVPGSPVLPGALPERRPLQPHAGDLRVLLLPRLRGRQLQRG